MAEGSALVLVLPGDTVEAIADRVRQAPPGDVQLLVSEGVAVLQVASNFVRLGQALGPRWRDLQLISSDEQTLRIARALKIETVGVLGAHVGQTPAPATASPAPPAEPSPAPTTDTRSEVAAPASLEVPAADRVTVVLSSDQVAPAAGSAPQAATPDPSTPSAPTDSAVQATTPEQSAPSTPSDNVPPAATPPPASNATTPSDNAPPAATPLPASDATIVLPPALAAESAKTIVLPPVPSAPQLELSPDDAAFLDALERMPAQDEYSDPRPDNADLYDDMDDFSDVIGAAPPRPPRGSSAPITPTRRPDPTHRDEPPRYIDQPRRRSSRRPPEDEDEYGWEDEEFDQEEELPPRRRASDYDADDEELLRRRQVRRGDLRAGSTSGTRSGRRSGRLLALDEEEPPRRRTAAGLLPLLLALLAVALLFGLGALWFLSARATVTVYVPPPQTRSFAGEVLPVDSSTENGAPGAIEALPLKATVAFTVTGEGTQEPTPSGYAQGAVRLVNRLDTPLDLPAGTEFIARNPAGEEVRFWNPDPASVPAATSAPSPDGLQIITTLGSATVPVRARSPGSQANTDANVIGQIVINGQVVGTESGNLQISHDPLTGGSEENQFVVTQQAVDAAVAGSYRGLYDAAQAQLKAMLIDAPRFSLDEATILPRFNEQTQSFDNLSLLGEPIVNPPIGTPLDPNNPAFSVQMQVNVDGLATPPNRSIQQQFNDVLPAYLQNRQPPLCRVEEELANIQYSGWQWDGTRLTVDGSADCRPNAAEIDRRVREAVLGERADIAESKLLELQALGLIDSFQLPAVERLPGQGFLLEVVTTSSSSPLDQTALPAEPTPEGAQP
ncbi:MAG TPA: hypothetical protein VFS21_04660 [Roseiflexaceae bacterium]|nr:hypothetical protein [Roseiflexaceae bacterium]